MEREKKSVWKHWTIIQKNKGEKHPHARCNYCPKEFKQAIPKRIQEHLDKKCPNAPNNAKSQSRYNIESCMSEKNQESFEVLLDKALPLVEMLSSYPFIQWYQKEAENENVFAQYFLGKCYEHGDGFERDEKRHLNGIKNQLNKNTVKHNHVDLDIRINVV